MYVVPSCGKENRKSKFRVRINKIEVGLVVDELSGAKKADQYIVKHKLNLPLNFPGDYPSFVPNEDTPKNTKIRLDNDLLSVKVPINASDGDYVYIDEEDYDAVKYHTISLNPGGYYSLSIKGNIQLLARFLMKVTDTTVFVDHIDSDKSNCRKSNLRIATSSRYIGVYRLKGKDKWKGYLSFSGNKVSRTFNNEQDASHYRDMLCQEHVVGGFHKLNHAYEDIRSVKQWITKFHLSWNAEVVMKWVIKLYKKVTTAQIQAHLYEHDFIFDEESSVYWDMLNRSVNN
jgi:hypothetical protein